jgi:NADH-quinone oxidoreductase subunit N
MIVGNLLALQQQNLKRLLAYSSIAHLGYLIVAFLPGDNAGVEASIFYLLSYSITLLASFGIIALMSTREKDAEDLANYRGLFWRNPILAAVLTVALLSLAGIPLTSGFLAKFFVLTTGVQHNLWLPVIVLALTSVIGLYYYLRIISTLFAAAGEVQQRPDRGDLHPFFIFVSYGTLVVMMMLLFWLGILPGVVVDGIRDFLRLY